MTEINELLIQEYKNQIKILSEENTELQKTIMEHQLHEDAPYSKEQAQLLFKIQKVKNELNQQKLRMTGHNNYKNYNYFELRDFVPCTVALMCKYGISSRFFTKEGNMYLHIIDSETGAWIQTHTPLKEPHRKEYPKGDIGVLMKDQQAVHTYARRTLWLLVLELVEPVTLEQDEKKTSKNDELRLPDTLPESVADTFKVIKKDFGDRVPFQEIQIRNKLRSLLRNQKIDQTTYDQCIGVLKDEGASQNM